MIPNTTTNRHAILQCRGYARTRTERVPKNQSEVIVLLSLLTELQESTLACIGIEKVDH